MDTINGHSDVKQLEAINHQLVNFISLAEEAVSSLETAQVLNQQKEQGHEKLFEHELNAVRASLEALDEMIANAGMSRLQLAAEKLLQESEKRLQEIQEMTIRFQQTAERCAENLKHTSETSADWIAEAMQSLQIDKFRKMIFENVDHVENVVERSEKRIKALSRRLHWDKLLLALFVAVMVSILTAMFINDEMPWETHSQVMMERHAGQVLLQAWPKLSTAEKAHIQHISSGSVV